jgi:hypothetical protein
MPDFLGDQPVAEADGGLMSYGVDTRPQQREAAGYVNRILCGEKPSDLSLHRAAAPENQLQDTRGTGYAWDVVRTGREFRPDRIGGSELGRHQWRLPFD